MLTAWGIIGAGLVVGSVPLWVGRWRRARGNEYSRSLRALAQLHDEHRARSDS